MTDKEKARAYDEALAKAKEQYNYPCMRSCMGILEEIFPELKESEDERIRKAIINAIHDYAKRLEEKIPTEWLAWLEKQGKQKPAWSEEDEEKFEDVLHWFSIFCEKNQTISGIKESFEWLKSLTPQNRWKPSDEQMEALKAMTRYCDIATSFDAYKQRVVESLYSELKKLKEKKL